MNTFMESVTAACASPQSALVSLSVLAGLMWQAWGLATSRQWFLLPLAAGLLGLATFLLNPLADSTSSIDLQNELLRGRGPLAVCMIQLVTSAAAIWLGLRSAGDPQSQRWPLLLGCLHSLPVAMVLIGAVIVQQNYLAQQVGSRPEWVGAIVGCGLTATLLILTCLFAVAPRMWRVKGHLLSGLWVGALAALMTSLDSSLPAVGSSGDPTTKLREVLVGAGLAVLLLSVGFCWERWSKQPSLSR